MVNFLNLVLASTRSPAEHARAAQHAQNMAMATSLVNELAEEATEHGELRHALARMEAAIGRLPVPALPLSSDPYRSGMEVQGIINDARVEAQDMVKIEDPFNDISEYHQYLGSIQNFTMAKWQAVEDLRRILHPEASDALDDVQGVMEELADTAELNMFTNAIPHGNAHAMQLIEQNFLAIID